ncbi:hypothetical protein G3435_16700 [Pseudomonas sp. MAFF212428]|uniref:Lipoprotein n=1 Tax=Pseudomonas brassicae TaxID=2708063 RepID=A0A6B3NVE0_9PSED|nr:hypothetical protein [Pseudomonas brassicae]NER61167.1 hypothetical protein [Pseudomonas brassicae]NER65001.1 hypothetical protein [Pseudomonas brassicae]
MKKSTKITTALFATWLLAGCQVNTVVSKITYPSIKFFGKGGAIDGGCTIVMTVGTHSFRDNDCSNDDYYYFKILNPVEGLKFGIYGANYCASDEAYSRYYVRNPPIGSDGSPLPMPSNGELLRVDAARYAEEEPLSPGLYPNGWRGQQLHGKVSSICVEANQ